MRAAVSVKRGECILTAEEFRRLREVPAEAEWFANISSEQARRAHQIDVRSFMAFVGIERPEEFRTVTRAHIIAWREELGSPATFLKNVRGLS